MQRNQCDVVVIGSGVAGLATALYLDGRRVTIISKSQFAHGGSSEKAQGGVAVALGKDDSPQLHAKDTTTTGCGLTKQSIARLVTTDGPHRIAELLRLGLRLDRESSGEIALGREAAHSRRRVVHAAGDGTGAELVNTLATAVRTADGVHIVENTMALELVRDASRVVGVVTVDDAGVVSLWEASAVVLATGGCGRVYAATTNPVENTGDGLAMAARAGARLSSLEFMQFHPTALNDGSDPMALLTEALRGESSTLLDENGARFMPEHHPLAELAPRDVVARSIWQLLDQGHEVFLDARVVGDAFPRRFPTVYQLCRHRGLDPRTQTIPVSPAAHYHMGGVVVDQQGRTSLPGLWACGEVSVSGLHGANRLASNSLLEALVFGARIGESLARALMVNPTPSVLDPTWVENITAPSSSPWIAGSGVQEGVASKLRELMWRMVGVQRCAAGMKEALQEIRSLAAVAPTGSGELHNLLLVAELITRAALARTESRGAHFRSDFPFTSPDWQQDLVFEGTRLRQPVPIRTSRRAAG